MRKCSLPRAVDKQRWARRLGTQRPSLGPLAIAGHAALAATIALLVLWAVFLFDVGTIGDTRQFADRPQWQQIPAIAKQTPVPMPSLPLGVLQVVGHSITGHPTYYNGEVSFEPGRGYFGQSLLMKTPPAVLVAWAIALVLLPLSVRRRGRAMLLLLPALLFFTIASTGSIQIGLRHLLPILPLLYLAAAGVLTEGRAVWRRALLGVAILVTAIETATWHPSYLAYFNVSAGDRPERYYVDSNLDWGQDFDRLRRWLEREMPGEPYTLDLVNRHSTDLARVVGLRPVGGMAEAYVETTARPGTLFAISHSAHVGPWNYKWSGGQTLTKQIDYRWLDDLTPIATIGGSINVYDLRNLDRLPGQ